MFLGFFIVLFDFYLMSTHWGSNICLSETKDFKQTSTDSRNMAHFSCSFFFSLLFFLERYSKNGALRTSPKEISPPHRTPRYSPHCHDFGGCSVGHERKHGSICCKRQRTKLRTGVFQPYRRRHHNGTWILLLPDRDGSLQFDGVACQLVEAGPYCA